MVGSYFKMVECSLAETGSQAEPSTSKQKPERTCSKEAKSATKGASDKGRAKAPVPKKDSTASDRDARRCQKALEKQFAKVQRQAGADEQSRASLGVSKFSCSLQPELSPQLIEARQQE